MENVDILASDQERESTVTHLRAAYQEGRLTQEELEEREAMPMPLDAKAIWHPYY